LIQDFKAGAKTYKLNYIKILLKLKLITVVLDLWLHDFMML